MSSFPITGPFQDYGTFQECMKYLELPDIGHAASVCKSWNKWIQSSSIIWKNLFHKEGIPLVESVDGKPRDYRADFKVLYPITISGKVIGRLFGKVMGEIPPIREECFNRLKEEDPFEEGKTMGENYVFVVVPSLILRTVGPQIPLVLDESGNLINSEQENEHDLAIPLSLKNLRVLCSYPLNGKENMPVFDEKSWEPIFEQCGSCANKVAIDFMRKRIVEQSRRMSYTYQKALVEKEGFEVISLLPRALFDSVEILRSGTCSDDRNSRTYARSADIVHYYNLVYQSGIGIFVPRAGLCVGNNYDVGYDGYEDVGVVPGVPAEVLQT